MKERLYDEEGRETEESKKLLADYDDFIYKFIESNKDKYDIRDLESVMKWHIEDDILQIIVGF